MAILDKLKKLWSTPQPRTSCSGCKHLQSRGCFEVCLHFACEVPKTRFKRGVPVIEYAAGPKGACGINRSLWEPKS